MILKRILDRAAGMMWPENHKYEITDRKEQTAMWNIIIIPFLGTVLGAASVFLFKKEMGQKTQRALTGFASGVMVSASFFSLLLPALDQTEDMGKLGFLPVSVGFGIGMLFLLVMDMITPHMHLDKNEEGPRSGLKRTTKLVLAVTLHNLP